MVLTELKRRIEETLTRKTEEKAGYYRMPGDVALLQQTVAMSDVFRDLGQNIDPMQVEDRISVGTPEGALRRLTEHFGGDLEKVVDIVALELAEDVQKGDQGVLNRTIIEKQLTKLQDSKR